MPVVELPGGPIGQQLPGLKFGVEVGDRELYRLPCVQRPSERATLLAYSS